MCSSQIMFNLGIFLKVKQVMYVQNRFRYAVIRKNKRVNFLNISLPIRTDRQADPGLA